MVDFFSATPIPVPLSDERLAEIEGLIHKPCISAEGFSCTCRLHDAAVEMAAEVRRLKRENRLLHLSRGEIGLD